MRGDVWGDVRERCEGDVWERCEGEMCGRDVRRCVGEM